MKPTSGLVKLCMILLLFATSFAQVCLYKQIFANISAQFLSNINILTVLITLKSFSSVLWNYKQKGIAEFQNYQFSESTLSHI